MRKKILSLLLCTLLLGGAALTVTPAARAVDGGTDEGMALSKTAVYDPATDTTTITLEAYATGEATISIIEEDIPTDIILVLDQSGSMSSSMGTVSFSAITGNNRRNSSLYERRHNGGSGNLWYSLGDGSYASVSVQITGGGDAISPNQPNSHYLTNANNLYQLVDGGYVPVTVERTGAWYSGYTYHYTSPAGLDVTSSGTNTTPDFGDLGPLYLLQANSRTYVYTCTGADEETIEIGSSTGANTNFTAATLYSRAVSNTGGGSRLAALTSALNGFVSAVNAKAAGPDGELGTADDVNHRVAVAGFASQSGYGNNTELLSIAGSNSGSVGVAYNNITTQNYRDVLQSMDTAAGRSMVAAAVGALAAEGATRADLGMAMAQNILANNPVPTGEQRNRVVVMFTDGAPTTSNGFELNVADAAIGYANTIKNTYGATVYAVGVFANADPATAGARPGSDLGENSAQLPAACNWFMQSLSSNNGSPQSPSYYLAASDAASLSSIFQQIASQIHTGGSTVSLDEQTVIRDVVSPSFAMPEGTTAADIVLKTYACTGVDGGGNYTWSENPDAMGATVTIGSTGSDPTTTDNQINVTGFDFAENYVGPVNNNGIVTYRGHKLVIAITVERREGFFGGNQVRTNTSAGIYEDGDAEAPLYTFDQPTVDMPLLDMTVSVENNGEYLGSYYGQSIPEGALALGSQVVIGGIALDMSPTAVNYGLEPWQNEYVDIAMTESIQGNNGSLENVVEDITYTVTLTVAPKYPGTIHGDGTSDTGSGSVHVFRPELTYRDATVYYGAAAEPFGPGSLVNSTWVNTADGKHHDDENVHMLNAEPALTLTYTPDADPVLTDGAVALKTDFPVKAAVAMGGADITGVTVFVHQPCDPDCGWTTPQTPGDPAFLVHVRTCALTITKTGGNEGEPYVFTVLRNGVPYTEAAIVGNGSATISELPVGEYTIAEDEGWSWRFTPGQIGTAALSGDSPTGSVSCVNTGANDHWLNGYSDVATNIAGVPNG